MAKPSLSCGMWDLYLQHVRSSSLTRDGTWGPLPWECGILATGPLGKSLGRANFRIRGIGTDNSMELSATFKFKDSLLQKSKRHTCGCTSSLGVLGGALLTPQESGQHDGLEVKKT